MCNYLSNVTLAAYRILPLRARIRYPKAYSSVRGGTDNCVYVGRHVIRKTAGTPGRWVILRRTRKHRRNEIPGTRVDGKPKCVYNTITRLRRWTDLNIVRPPRPRVFSKLTNSCYVSGVPSFLSQQTSPGTRPFRLFENYTIVGQPSMLFVIYFFNLFTLVPEIALINQNSGRTRKQPYE